MNVKAWIRRAIVAVLFLHAIGQIMGILPALRLIGVGTGTGPDWMRSWSSQSWLLQGSVNEAGMRILCATLFTLGLVGFLLTIAAFFGIGLPQTSWPTIAAASGVLSLAAGILFWNALVLIFPHKIGNLAANLAVIVYYLMVRFGSAPLLR